MLRSLRKADARKRDTPSKISNWYHLGGSGCLKACRALAPMSSARILCHMYTLTISGANNAITSHFIFRHFCSDSFLYSGMFRWTAVQTHSTSVNKHDRRILNVPRTSGSGTQVWNCVAVWLLMLEDGRYVSCCQREAAAMLLCLCRCLQGHSTCKQAM
jgi:hypothetical protein